MNECEVSHKGKPLLIKYTFESIDDCYQPHYSIGVEIVDIIDLTTNERWEDYSHADLDELSVDIATKIADEDASVDF
jgi:hypothetical protein